jgi:hypothetical protein
VFKETIRCMQWWGQNKSFTGLTSWPEVLALLVSSALLYWLAPLQATSHNWYGRLPDTSELAKLAVGQAKCWWSHITAPLGMFRASSNTTFFRRCLTTTLKWPANQEVNLVHRVARSIARSVISLYRHSAWGEWFNWQCRQRSFYPCSEQATSRPR